MNLLIKSLKHSLSVFKFLACLLIGLYKMFSGMLGTSGVCRFYPSCSDYALQAYLTQPFLKASQLTLKRLLSCHPFSKKDGLG